MQRAMDDHTLMLVGSAPSFPFGLIDPISDLSRIAEESNVWLHVDACVGGYIAPFAKHLGEPIPSFDFEQAGVVSMSADLHKYGYAAKGASTVFFVTSRCSATWPLILIVGQRVGWSPHACRYKARWRDCCSLGCDEFPRC